MAKTITTKIDCKCGIWDTCYKISDRGDSILVSAPYVKWVGNSGNLAFRKVKVLNPKQMGWLREMVDSYSLCTDGANPITIDDVINDLVI